MNGQVAERKQALLMTSYPSATSITAGTIHFLFMFALSHCRTDKENNWIIRINSNILNKATFTG